MNRLTEQQLDELEADYPKQKIPNVVGGFSSTIPHGTIAALIATARREAEQAKELNRLAEQHRKDCEVSARNVRDLLATENAVRLLTGQVTHWKSNHEREVMKNRELRDRPDLGDRCKSIDDKNVQIATLTTELATARAERDEWKRRYEKQCEGTMSRMLEIEHVRSNRASLESRLERAEKALREIATPDAKERTVILDNERHVVVPQGCVQWRMDTAEKALAALDTSPLPPDHAKQLAELREAVRVAVNAMADLSGLVNCETWCDARKGGHCKCGNEQDHAAIIDAAKKNAILAKAITEAKS